MKRKLYHYTSLSTLASILTHRQIKFNNLTLVDDIEEGISSDVGNLGRYCFVSSWTEDGVESIPMWNMYSGLNGIRIGLQENPFSIYEWKDPLNPSETINSVFSEKELFQENRYPVIQDEILFKVNYTDDKTFLYPEIKEYVQNGYHVNIAKLGKSKNLAWKFQKEWRYALYFYPISLQELITNRMVAKQKLKQNLYSNADIMPSCIYLHIREECFDDFEVLCGPKMNDGEKIILKCLLEKYSPKTIVRESNLKLR